MRELVDMKMDDSRSKELSSPYPTLPAFSHPPGLRICLTGPEVEKLGLDGDVRRGDYLHLVAFATVASVHEDEGGHRIELQIEKMAVEDESCETPGDDEGEEGEEASSDYE